MTTPGTRIQKSCWQRRNKTSNLVENWELFSDFENGSFWRSLRNFQTEREIIKKLTISEKILRAIRVVLAFTPLVLYSEHTVCCVTRCVMLCKVEACNL